MKKNFKPYNPAEVYDNKWLKTTLVILKDNLKDLSMWSVYNDDKLNEEIDLLKRSLEIVTDRANLLIEQEEKV